ncbi:hypothetical protein CIB84_004971 [Bambusicola thoracicus]|uniref:Uncharacterized protein n=1 Tax=Bambusicola thoracicus TaxID=9083 RepID=A0A2P4T4K3_BAMTH|nr:hypothetical protein CIB84_004971 [Bambusicola thoracicus]
MYQAAKPRRASKLYLYISSFIYCCLYLFSTYCNRDRLLVLNFPTMNDWF